jgi:hypothetical protein
MTSTDRRQLTSSQPYPPAWSLPDRYRRHAPSRHELREAIGSCVGARPWAELTWSGLVESLLAVGRTDVPLARLVEGHVDALRILGQADRLPHPQALYGVWASRSRRTGVRAVRDAAKFRLSGTLRFASGAGVIDRALVPVWLDADHHQLLDLDVRDLPVDATAWVTSAMQVSASHSVEVDLAVSADEASVGPLDFYLNRPGFFPGGIGVAACWAGGAARIVDLLLERPAAGWSETATARLGAARVWLTIAAAAIRSSAGALDDLPSDAGVEWRAISTEVRAAVAAAVGGVLDNARRIAGAAGFSHDAAFSHAYHDLDLYVLQQNADADRAYLGSHYLA